MTMVDGTDLASIDVLSNRVFAEGVPHEALAQLRRDRPIHFQTIPDERLYPQAWVLTKYEDVLAVSKDTDRFVNAHGLNLRASYSDQEDRHLLNLDDPEHLRLRRMTNKNFTPRVVRRYTEHYHDMVGRLIDDAIERGSGDSGETIIDVVDDISVPMPLLAICELLGTTPDDREQLVRWSNAIITNDDPDYSPSEEYRTQAGEEMMQYALDMLAERRDSPKDDLASVLAEKLALGELSIEEYSGYVTLLFVAGNETTRNNISHGLLQLAQNPDQYELLKTGEHWDTAVEEMIRWSSPVIYMSRTVVDDVDYKGHHFAKGDKVVLHYASANRDEDVFENPMTFDVTRDPNPHIAFGFGAHFCLGAHLARLETRCVLEQLVQRVDRLELVGQEAYVWSSFIAGIKKLDVKLALN
jgi:cholest-4-en-3-one 26-monooxygenase